MGVIPGILFASGFILLFVGEPVPVSGLDLQCL